MQDPSQARPQDRPIEVMDERTQQRSFGWVFFYQSKEFVVGKVDSARLFGVAPIIVNRTTGRATATGTALPVDDYVEAYGALGPDRFEAGEWRTFLRAKIQPIDE